MDGTFDPYYKWLAIPGEEQPPDHYRLLGIPLFTDDPDVIENLAEQRLRHIRSYQIGPRSEEATALLNELAAARACLLDAGRKAQYDAALRKQHHSVDKLQRDLAAETANVEFPNTDALTPVPDFVVPSTLPPRVRQTRSKAKPFPPALILTGLCGAGIVGLAAAWYVGSGVNEMEDEREATAQARIVDPSRPTNHLRSPSNAQNDASAADVSTGWSNVITTRDGRGADAMVQRDQPNRFGDDPLLGIRADSDVEMAHSYLRFDLSQFTPERRRQCSIKLVLSVLGRSLPKSGELQVLGIEDLPWSESQLDWNRSPSMQPFDRESLLITSPIASDHIAVGSIVSEIHLSSQAFRDFIVDCGPTVTLVITGNVGDQQWLRFTSGEHSNQYAPKLRFQMPDR